MAGTGEMNPVMDAVELWKHLPKSKVREFRDKDGLLNEMALMFASSPKNLPLS